MQLATGSPHFSLCLFVISALLAGGGEGGGSRGEASVTATPQSLRFSADRSGVLPSSRTINVDVELNGRQVYLDAAASSNIASNIDLFLYSSRAGDVLQTLDGSALIVSRQNAVELRNPDTLTLLDSGTWSSGRTYHFHGLVNTGEGLYTETTYAGYFADPDGHLREIAWNPRFWVGPQDAASHA